MSESQPTSGVVWTFLYIAASDLIPQLQRERRLVPSLWQLGLVLAGVFVMALPLMLE